MKNFLLSLFSFLLISNIYSQPFTLKKEIEPTKLEFHKFNPTSQPKAKGRLNVTEVTQVKDTMYFFADQMSIYSPVYVGVTTEDKDNALDIRISKMNWNNSDRSGSTGSTGHWDATFKTENDFGIMIIAKNKPVKYSLVAWNGSEVDFKLPSVFSNDPGAGDNSASGDKATTKSGKGFFQQNTLYIIIAVLIAVIAFLFIKMRNKKTS